MEVPECIVNMKAALPVMEKIVKDSAISIGEPDVEELEDGLKREQLEALFRLADITGRLETTLPEMRNDNTRDGAEKTVLEMRKGDGATRWGIR